MTTKAVRRRKMHGLVGTQRWLPGLARDHEYKLRTEIANHFEPRDFLEGMWIVDIAYCAASIELRRAQITAVKRRQMHGALAEAQCGFELDQPGVGLSKASIGYLKSVADDHFDGELFKQFFDTSAAFQLLAEASNGNAVDAERELKLLLHQETKERDRLINQIHRNRRQSMRDAVFLVEAKRRANGELDNLVAPYNGSVKPGDADGHVDYEEVEPHEIEIEADDRLAEEVAG